MNIVLISTYELGHQPYVLASLVSWLEESKTKIDCLDLSRQKLELSLIKCADLVAIHLPMHTATRLAQDVVRSIRTVNQRVHICAFGLYAAPNAAFLSEIGVDTWVSGEPEVPITDLVQNLQDHNSSKPKGPLGVDGIWLGKQQFKIPNRSKFDGLADYTFLTMPDGSKRTVGYTEATRGCKHTCRHCPIVPIYNGAFRVIDHEVVLDDIHNLVAAGAEHITFGDPDFFNAPGHAKKIMTGIRDVFPDITFDAVIKVEHLLKHSHLLTLYQQAGGILITSAVESLNNETLQFLDKGHTRADFFTAVTLTKDLGIAFAPTFVAFHPWLKLEHYGDLLHQIAELGLIQSVPPIQLAIRLLIPSGSKLLALPELGLFLRTFDPEALCHHWVHEDPAVDLLQQDVQAIVDISSEEGWDRQKTFQMIWTKTQNSLGRADHIPAPHEKDLINVPHLSELWYCCAEPSLSQMTAMQIGAG